MKGNHYLYVGGQRFTGATPSAVARAAAAGAGVAAARKAAAAAVAAGHATHAPIAAALRKPKAAAPARSPRRRR